MWTKLVGALGCSVVLAASEWTWTGFEVMGLRTVEREDVLSRVPLQLGAPCTVDRETWNAWGQALEDEFDFASVSITCVRYVGGEAYLVVDVIEQGEESRGEFRASPDGSVPIPPPLDDLFAQLRQRLDALFEAGSPPAESVRDGHLVYADEEAQSVVAQLVEQTPAHRDTLLATLREDASGDRRARAATLLNWAGDAEDSIRQVHTWVDDPDASVRNNLTRFMLHYVKDLKSEETAVAIARAMAQQLDRPSHGDRNKSLYALLFLAQAHPAVRPEILVRCGDRVREMGERSVLSNVRDPARELWELLQEER